MRRLPRALYLSRGPRGSSHISAFAAERAPSVSGFGTPPHGVACTGRLVRNRTVIGSGLWKPSGAPCCVSPCNRVGPSANNPSGCVLDKTLASCNARYLTTGEGAHKIEASHLLTYVGVRPYHFGIWFVSRVAINSE